MNTPSMFQVGDIVALNSGGPPMTVTHTLETSITVSWFSCDEFNYQVLSQNAVFLLDEECDCENPLGHAG